MKVESKEIQFIFDSFKLQVCKDPTLQPFLNVFHFQGDHIDQEKIGELFGIIHVSDFSEQSGYLPNVIAQVIKKEFFKPAKMATQENIELALHKTNSQLGDLVRHGNANWIGNLHAVIGCFNKNSFSFSHTGNAKIFFIRNKKILEITKGLEKQDNNPIKTFSNLSSGTVESGDKIIFCTESVQESLSVEDLERHINAFSPDEFDNIFDATLKAEGKIVGAIIVNVKEKEIQKVTKTKKAKPNNNYFGTNQENSSKKNEKTSTDQTLPSAELGNIPTEKENLPNKIIPGAATLEGHEINEDGEQKKDESKNIKDAGLSPFEKQPELFIGDEESEKIEKEIEQNNSFQKKFFALIKDLSPNTKPKKKGKEISDYLTDSKQEKQNNALETKLNDAGMNSPVNPHKPNVSQGNSSKSYSYEDIQIDNENNPDQKLANYWNSQKIGEKTSSLFKTLLSLAKTIFKNPNPGTPQKKEDVSKKCSHKKISLVVIIVLLILLIVLGATKMFGKQRNKKDQENSAPQTILESINNSDLSETNEEHFEKITEFGEEVLQLTADNGKLYVSSNPGKEIFYEYDIRNGSKKELEIKQNSASEIHETMVAMDVLNFIFFISKGKLSSYNRVTGNIEEHRIDFPENMDLVGAETKGTYLYLSDRTSGQIYRYPRSESNSFGAPKLWLGAQADLTKAIDFAVDDSIYITYSDGKIEKYFKSKLEKSFLLETETKITAHKITTIDDFPFYYVLDQKNGIAAKVEKTNNSIEKIFHSDLLVEARDIYLESEGKNVFVLTADNSLWRLKE